MSECVQFSLKQLLADHKLDTVERAFAYSDGTDMTIPGLGHRERWTLTLKDQDGCDHVVFMKRYGREPLKWVLRRWMTNGIGGSPASVEHDNIQACLAAGVAAIDQSHADHEMSGLIPLRSYIVLTKVPGEALEQCLEGFLERHSLDSETVARFTVDLASLVGRFHRAGFVHRDLYTSHVFLTENGDDFSMCLIDLARMFSPRWRRFRWYVKDLAQLKYSMPDAWIEKYWDMFMQHYLQNDPAGLAGKFNAAIDRKVSRIGRHDVKLQARRAELKRQQEQG